MSQYLTERRLFIGMAVLLLLATTERFHSDLPAFFWSLIVLGGVMHFD